MGIRSWMARLAAGRGSSDTPQRSAPADQHKSMPLTSLMPSRTEKPEWRSWSTDHAVSEGYNVSTWVYAAIEKRRVAVASVPWHVEVRNSDGEWERKPDHPLQELIDTPNPDFTQRQMISRLVQWLDLGGNVYWTKVRAGRRSLPAEIWPIMPDAMRVKTGGPDGRLIAGYRYEWGNVRHDFPAEDVTHFTYPAPNDFFYGQSPLRAAGMSVDIDTEAQRYQKVSLQNRGIPDGVFTLRGEGIGRSEWEQARDEVREQYQTKDAYRAPWVVTHADWQQMSLSPVDLDYINSRANTRVEILSAFGVPPPLVGVYDDATLANIETGRQIFWRDTILPLLEEIRDQFNRALVPEFGPVADLRIVYDVTNVHALRESFDSKVEAAERLWKMGVPFNEIAQRLELGFDEIPGGDTGFISASLLPMSMAAGPAPGDDTTSTEPEASAPDSEGEPDDGEGTLNSAQVEAIMTLIEQVARGELPRASAIAIISGSFPISRDDAEAMVGEVGSTFFIDEPAEGEQRAALPDEVKRRVRDHKRVSVADLAALAYGDD